MSDASNVTTAKPAGGIYRAPLGTTLPTDASTALSDAFVSIGYVSEDGLTNSNTRESTEIKDWGGTTVYTGQNSYSDVWKLKLIESLNSEALETVFGDDNVTVDTTANTIKVEHNDTELTEAVYVIDMTLRNGTLKRVVIADGKVSSVADIIYKNDEAVGFEIEITALPSTAISGNTSVEYIALAS